MVITSAELVNGRYRLTRQIGAGGMGVVFEAHDRLTGGAVALKRVSPGSGSSTAVQDSGAIPASVDIEVLTLHLAREFQLLASLRHPHIISVLDYGVVRSPEDGEPRLYYTMELLRDAQTILEVGKDAPPAEKIRLAVELLEALAYLHRRGILHCDLKPENVLVSASGRVKVVDFGLSSLRGSVSTAEGGQVAGTLAYMAPELLKGGAQSEASDLYAAGLMIYQLLTGIYPYDRSTVAALLRNIVSLEPDLTPLYLFDMPEQPPTQPELILSEAPTLPAIVRRLLAKNPEERYSSAGAIIVDLAAAGLPIRPESHDVRESFLQAAQFVGRDSELERLRSALAAALDGQGSAYLIGGESGIGKSRLLNELRTYALISGAQVLTGQSVEGGGLVYQVWREPLRRLALTTPLTALQAGVLKGLIPDLAALLERPVPDAPPVDGHATLQRLMRTIIEVFRRQTAPTVLLVEDLQWARESLDILRALLPLTSEQPLLIIGSYRSEEAGGLSAELPTMIPILLDRLEPAEIEALSASMLGETAASGVAQMLHQETEGNVLFIVEVVRALAEEAGALERVGTQSHPFRMLSGGVQAALRRRLGRIPARSRPLLEAAAVAGRVIELNVLERIGAANAKLMPPEGISTWLLDCSDAAVLEIFDGQWRFAHDKLREVLLIDLMERGDLPQISGIVARAVEAAYPGAEERASRAAVLADHWLNAGDTAREAESLEMAARVALQKALYEQTLEFIARARPLTKPDDARLARLTALATEAHYNLGGLDKARESAMSALALFGYSMHTARDRQRQVMPLQLVMLLLKQIRPRLRRSPQYDERKMYAMRLLEQLTMVHYFRNERAEIDYFSLYSANVAENANGVDQVERVRGYTTAAVALGSARRTLARYFMRRSDRAVKTIQDADTVTWHSLGTGMVHAMYGDWDEVEQRLGRGIELARTIGNTRRQLEGYVALVAAYYYQGCWDEARSANAEMMAVADQHGDIQAHGWALDNIGRFALREGRLEDARTAFRRGYDIYSNVVHDAINSIWCLGSIAKTYLSEGDLESARPFVEQVLAAVRDVRQTSFGMTEPLSAAAEYYLTLMERDGAQFALNAEARTAMLALRQYAENFLLARPRYYAFAGWRRRLIGDTRGAIRRGMRAVSEAERMNMRYDVAVASIELARHYARHDPRREEALRRAIDLLIPLGAAVDLGRAQRLLYNPDES